MTQFIHVGYPKTGTTWLQKQVFPYIKNYKKIIKNIVLKNIVSPTINEKILFESFQSISNETNLIISDEDLITFKPEHISPFQKAERIKQLFPNSCIFLFIRNQVEIIPSAYNQYIRGGGVLTFKSYLEQIINSKKIDFWKYDIIIEKYVKLFGIDSIKIYLFEDLISNPSFLKQFMKENNFQIRKEPNFKRNKNTGLSPFICKIWRYSNHFTKHQLYSSFPPKEYYFHFPGLFSVNRFFLHILNSLFSKKCRREFIENEIFDFLNNYFKTSNEILIKRYNLEQIKKYNYPLS